MQAGHVRQAVRISRRGYATGYDYRTLQTTNHLGLPRLPIPNLADTLDRYLRSVSVWATTPDKLQEQQRLLQDFFRESGPRLQKALQEEEAAQAQKGGYPFSYIEKIWHDMYLCDRSAVAINSNPSYVLVDAKDRQEMHQTRRAARFVASALSFHRKVKAGLLEADKAGMCLSPMALQFGTARIPQDDRDALEHHFDSQHIVVLHRDRFYKIDVLTRDGKQISAHDLALRFDSILADAHKDAPPVGSLTGNDRAKWATIRKELNSKPTNKATLATIDSALLVVAFDSEDARSLHDLSISALTSKTGRNRWFDKHSLIALPNGTLELNLEHSFSDGVNWNRWLWEAWCDMHGKDSGYSPLPPTAANGELGASFGAPQELSWDLTPDLQAKVQEGAKWFQDAINALNHNVIAFEEFGKAEIKKWRVSPDAMAQIAFQVAFFQQHGVMAATYEACSTSTFHHGRTETIRSATTEVAQVIKAINANSATPEDLRKAAARHSQVSKDAQKAQGIDRHLFALRTLQQQLDGRLHPLFQHPLHQQSRWWRLSTSTVPLPCIRTFNFGAVVPDGYGIGYAVNENSITGIVTNFVGQGTDGSRLTQDIGHSLQRFQRLLKP